jgi:hypothetical protein
VIQKLSIR